MRENAQAMEYVSPKPSTQVHISQGAILVRSHTAKAADNWIVSEAHPGQRRSPLSYITDEREVCYLRYRGHFSDPGNPPPRIDQSNAILVFVHQHAMCPSERVSFPAQNDLVFLSLLLVYLVLAIHIRTYVPSSYSFFCGASRKNITRV